MCEQRVMELVSEIHSLYLRTCAYAEQLQAKQDLESERLRNAVRPRRSSRWPEMQHFSSCFDWHDAFKRARQDPRLRKRTRVVQSVNYIIVFAAALACLAYTNSLFVMLGLIIVLGGGLVTAQEHFLIRPHVQCSLREQLVERGVPICIGCGYDLRGQIQPRCPECGRSCALADPKVRAKQCRKNDC
jgi:hypothetical protein